MADEKVEGKLDQAGGKVKEGVGKATGNESLERRGEPTGPRAISKKALGKPKTRSKTSAAN